MYASFLQPVVKICYQKIGLLFSLRVMIGRNQGANFTLVFPLILSMCLHTKRFWWFSEQWKTESLKFGSRKKDREEKKNTKNKKPCSFVCPQKQLLFGLIDILLSSFSRIKPQANTPSFLHVKVFITSERNSDIAFRMLRRLSCRSEFICFVLAPLNLFTSHHQICHASARLPGFLHRSENFIPVQNLATVSCKWRTTTHLGTHQIGL